MNLLTKINLRNQDNMILIGLKEDGFLLKTLKFTMMKFMFPIQEKFQIIVGIQV